MSYLRSHARLTPGRSMMRMMTSDMRPHTSNADDLLQEDLNRLQLYLQVQQDRLSILRNNYFVISQQTGQNSSGYPDPTKPGFSELKGISDKIRATEYEIKQTMGKMRMEHVLNI